MKNQPQNYILAALFCCVWSKSVNLCTHENIFARWFFTWYSFSYVCGDENKSKKYKNLVNGKERRDKSEWEKKANVCNK